MSPPSTAARGDVVMIRTGTANLASVGAAFRRLGISPEITTEPERVRAARAVVLPGVGAFDAAMTELHRHELVGVLRERVREERPLLGVCVGLHLLCEGSEEGELPGLGLIAGTVRRFPDHEALVVPHMGWSRVVPTPGARLVQQGAAYFAHSYRLPALPAGAAGGLAEHGGPFVAAIEQGRLFALQLHPELSGRWGEALLHRWLQEV